MTVLVVRRKGRMRLRSRALGRAIAGTGLMALAALSAPALAGAASFSTTATISISSTGGAFTGQVRSLHAACKPGRRVVLERRKAGQTSFSSVGATTSNSAGTWSVATSPSANAQYRATVAQRKVGSDTCSSATSPAVTARATTSTISLNGGTFKGKLASPSSSCLAARNVTLQRKRPGDVGFSAAGTATSDGSGNWAVGSTPVAGSSYRALVAARQVGATACMSGTSALVAPNLTVAAVSDPPSGLSEGATFNVTDTTRNLGQIAAGASTTRYYLTTDPARSLSDRQASTTNPRTSFPDILLIGPRNVPPLGSGGSSASGTPGIQLQVPGGTPAGNYYLLACADDRGVLAETSEADNCKASAGKQAVTAPAPLGLTPRVDAFNDTLPNVPPQIDPLLPQLLKVACGGSTPNPMSLAQAITSTRSYLAAHSAAGAMSQFQASPDYNSADALQADAGAAMLSNSPAPGAALVALLRAHELEPNEASHLVNAGGVAAAIGLPNQSLAFLDAALTSDDADRPPMGIPRQAVALASRGYDLLQLGKYAEAQRALQASTAMAPLLTEARATLAGVQACQGQDPRAAFRKGRRRTDRKPPPPDSTDPPPLDDSLGEETEMRNVPIPNLPETAYGESDFFVQLTGANSSALNGNIARQNQLRQQLDAANRLALSKRRTAETISLIDQVSLNSDLVTLRDQMASKLDAAQAEWRPLFQGTDTHRALFLDYEQAAEDACSGIVDEPAHTQCFDSEVRQRCIPKTRSVYSSWFTEMNQAYDKAKQYQRLYSKRVSGIAANLSDPRAYELAQLYIEVNGRVLFDEIAQPVSPFAFVLESATDDDVPLCVSSPDPQAPDPPPQISPQGPGGCPDALKGFSLNIDLGVASLSADCEELGIQGSTPGWIGAFGEVKFNVRDGTATIFAGAKGEVGLGPLSGDFKSGAYVKVGRDGPRDLGWRVGPSYTVGAGPAQFGGSDTTDLSFVGALGNLGL
jgi:tetratricopeptide (TPR) repeat protein